VAFVVLQWVRRIFVIYLTHGGDRNVDELNDVPTEPSPNEPTWEKFLMAKIQCRWC
jgi:hypothetical protein